MGLPLSLPELQASWAVLSVTSSTVTKSGGLGGPGSNTRTTAVRHSHMPRPDAQTGRRTCGNSSITSQQKKLAAYKSTVYKVCLGVLGFDEPHFSKDTHTVSFIRPLYSESDLIRFSQQFALGNGADTKQE